ncbi:MAG: hypothetical protein DCC68_25615 [Planctomycetota bacterium]|nr:MAG: hypothetical protein DCC68_25615 [Planctomycetota bacterium]
MGDDRTLAQLVSESRKRHEAKTEALKLEQGASPTVSVGARLRLNLATARVAAELLDYVGGLAAANGEGIPSSDDEFMDKLFDLDQMSMTLDADQREDHLKKRAWLIEGRELASQGAAVNKSWQKMASTLFVVTAAKTLSEINSVKDFAKLWRDLEKLGWFGLGFVPPAWPAVALRLFIEIAMEDELRMEADAKRQAYHANYFHALRLWAIAVKAYELSGTSPLPAKSDPDLARKAAEWVDGRIGDILEGR